VTRPHTGLPYLDAGRDRPGAVLAMAHRGGAKHPEIVGLENTLTAFAHAVALGYTYLETDVHATRDGVLLAFHDAVLDRVTDGTGAIAELTHAEVAQARVAGREHVPTMASLLDAFPQARFNIDVKSDAAVDLLVRLVRSTGSQDRVCVGSFSERRLARVRRSLGPRVATSCGPVTVALTRFADRRTSRLLTRNRGNVLQVPRARKGLEIVTRSFVEAAHAHGRPVHVWTVDDPPTMHELLDLGVDGIITDRTDLLRDVLLARSQWTGEPA